MLAQLLLVASTMVCTTEQIPEMKACRRCCSSGAVEVCKFIEKCPIVNPKPEEQERPTAPPAPSRPAPTTKPAPKTHTEQTEPDSW